MNKRTNVLFVVFCVLGIFVMIRGDVKAEQGMKYVGSLEASTTPITHSFLTPTSNYELIAGVSGKQIVVDAIIMASTWDVAMHFNDSNSVSDIGYGPYRTNSGQSTIIDRGISLRFATGASLYGTTYGRSGSADVCIEYHLK